jgi:hypothetical protein
MGLESCIHLKEPATLYAEAATQEWLNSLNFLFMLKSKEKLIAKASPLIPYLGSHLLTEALPNVSQGGVDST